MIEVEKLTKFYGNQPAISDLNFRVETGEILGFLGPNGAGKTTTMRILAGYLPASSGTARIAGHDVHSQPMAVRQSIGYLPENPPLYPEMTVQGFLHFVAELKGVSPGDRISRVDSAIRRCSLDDRRQTLIRKLSKGYRQRVGIAQAIVHDPPVIILDEPTVGLDPLQIAEVRRLIKSLAGQHTVILSTHILPEVGMTCDRVTIINKGQVVATNNPESLTAEMAAGSISYDLEVEGEPEEILRTLGDLSVVQSLTLGDREGLAPGHHRLAAIAQNQTDIGKLLAATVVGAGFGLYELRRNRVSLEDVFLKLTMTDTPPSAPSLDTTEDTLITPDPEPDPEPSPEPGLEPGLEPDDQP